MKINFLSTTATFNKKNFLHYNIFKQKIIQAHLISHKSQELIHNRTPIIHSLFIICKYIFSYVQ
ncbi:hypothetical protein BDB01DRAFT_797896 [Pilobolus umbonatus]|nr:hypothetical protein BDB01DRAFT_797896 [Pilobolus umbonatus]